MLLLTQAYQSSLNSLNPVWTLSQNCFFLYRPAADVFFETQNLVFEIRDWDAIGKDSTLGIVSVNKQDIINGTGDRKEFNIVLNCDFTKPNDDPVSSHCSLLRLLFCDFCQLTLLQNVDSACPSIPPGYG